MNKTEFKAQVKQYLDAINVDTDWVAGSEWMIESARAVDSWLADTNNDVNLPKLVASFEKLTIRDYVLGIINKNNKTHVEQINRLVSVVPAGIYAPACFHSLIAFESGDTKLALIRLGQASKKYELGRLLTRAYLAGWIPSSFTQMRTSCHPKVCEEIFGVVNA
jgi:hypothetical protein